MTQTQNNISTEVYRADIDGLRAIAVLSVIGFHAFPAIFSGGFVGVDIFFVISGYLITKLVGKEIFEHKFSFSQFYQRRIQRLFPALITVLLFTQIYSVFLYKDESLTLAQSLLAGAIFVANYFFWFQGGYFDSMADTKPLLHLWSLSIEEQFYLFWPLLLLLVYKIKNYYQWVLLLLLSASFAYSVLMTRLDAYAAFYSIQSRTWEFGVGAALVWLTSYNFFQNKLKSANVKNIFSLFGVLLVIGSILYLKPSMAFPGLLAALPVFGAALIILAGPEAYINRNVLNKPAFVWIGLISYPLYLWHWPLLVFARIELSAPPPEWIRATLIVTSVLLAWITYRFIETPLRRTPISKRKTLLLALVLALIAGAAYVQSQRMIKYTNNTEDERGAFANYYLGDLENRSLSVFESKFRHECNFYQVDKYYAGQTTLVPKVAIDSSCYTKKDPNDKSVLLWGDSNAQMLNFGLVQTLPQNWSILQVASSGCYPNADYTQDSEVNYCARSNWFAMNVIRQQKINVVVIAQSREHDLAQLQHIAQTLEKLGVERVIVMGSVPRWTELLPKIILRQLWSQRPNRTTVGLDQAVIEKNRRLARDFRRSDHSIFLNVIELFCNTQGCLTEVGSDSKYNLTTWDLGHLTQAASVFLADKLLANLVMGKTW